MLNSVLPRPCEPMSAWLYSLVGYAPLLRFACPNRGWLFSDLFVAAASFTLAELIDAAFFARLHRSMLRNASPNQTLQVLSWP